MDTPPEPEPTTQQENSINRRRSRTISNQQQPNQVQDNPLPCPRCDSTHTKFCYYNNYNLSQPRYFCKSCRRYWTHGGTLRPIPVGGATRKSLPVKRQRVRRPQPKVTTTETDHVAAAAVVVSDIGSGPVVDLNEAWWSGLTTDGLYGPDVSYGLGVLDWPMEKSMTDECSSSIIPWSEIGILTPSNEGN